MSNAYSYLTTGNTFGDWIVTTNGLVFENNNFNANNYHKAAGTLIIDEPTASLQANGCHLPRSSIQKKPGGCNH